MLANFGEAPFKADVESMKVEAARRLEAQIQETVLPARGKVWDPSCPAHDSILNLGAPILT